MLQHAADGKLFWASLDTKAAVVSLLPGWSSKLRALCPVLPAHQVQLGRT